MTSDGSERIGHARDLLATMFPGHQVLSTGAATAGIAAKRRFAVLPSIRHPRLLAPMAPGTAAGAALRAYGGRLRKVDQLSYRSLSAVLGATAGRGLRARLEVSPAQGDVGLDDHLSEILDVPVSIAAHLTPARANRKPIVQALADGERYPVAFAKLATNSLTTSLVEAEGAALRHLSGRDLGQIVIPHAFAPSAFDGNPLLVMRPLPTWSAGRLPTTAEVARASAELAAIEAPIVETLVDSTYWKRMRSDADAVTPTDRRDLLQRSMDRVEASAGTVEVAFGASHGDWSPWNMWRTTRGLLVWDWERFATDIPIGSDVVHYRLQELLQINRAGRLDAARASVASGPSRLVACLHLLALAVRYDKDDQTGAGATIAPTNEWLLPVVDEIARDGRMTTGHAA